MDHTTIEKAVEELKVEVANVCTEMQAAKKPSPAGLNLVIHLLGKMLRAIVSLADENKRLREESMATREVKRTMAGIVFGPVSKDNLN